MYAYNEDENIVLELDGFYDYDDLDEMGRATIVITEPPVNSCGEAVCAIANSGSTDFLELLNEGAPVCCGNSYAEYWFIALQDGYVFTYTFGQEELDKLNEDGEVVIEPLPWNDLDEVRSTEYMRG